MQMLCYSLECKCLCQLHVYKHFNQATIELQRSTLIIGIQTTASAVFNDLSF